MKKTFKGIVLGIIIATLLMSTALGASIQKTIDVVFNKVNVTVNGKAVQGENILYEGTTYVPLRAISEMLDKEVGWDGNTNTASINDKLPSANSDVSSVDKKDETTYGLDEWWKVENQWKLKIDSVSLTNERNRFSDENPEVVVVIKYTYENLGYEGRIQDLYIKPDNVVDGNKKVVTTYPAGANVNAKPTPIGAIMEGAEVSYGLTSNKGDLTIYFNEYDDSSTKHKAIFVIPMP